MADTRSVPPFVIFGDVTLQQMATYIPQSPESLSHISGVGTVKLKQFGDEFLTVIKNYSLENGLAAQAEPPHRRERNRSPQRAGPTLQETKTLLLQKLSIGQIAEQRGLSEKTILRHLERLVLSGEKLDL